MSRQKHQPKQLNLSRQGFTLAELLISLAILGVIATFTIPKILASQSEQKKVAVFRETIATLSGFLNAGLNNGEILASNGETQFRTYFRNRLNLVSIIDTGGMSSTAGVPNQCWGTTDGIRGWYGMLPNGACIAPLDHRTGNGNGRAFPVAIDWNGQEGPNAWNQDRLMVCLSYGSETYTGNSECGGYARRGEIVLWPQFGGGTQSLYDSIWK